VIIKLLLIAALVGAAFSLMRGKPGALSILMRRSITLAAIGLGCLAVLFPSSVTQVANAVGVGRGTDLVVYVVAVSFVFVSIALYMRLAAMQDRHVQLARRLALLEAQVESGAAAAGIESESR
jgi:hypothetical protein